MDLAEHFRIIWRNKWRIAGITLAIAVLVYVHSKSSADVYSSNAFVSVTSARAGTQGGQDDALALAKNYARLGGTKPLIADAVKRSKLDVSTNGAAGHVHLTTAADVAWITITVTGPTPTWAQKLASGEAAALIDAVKVSESERITTQSKALQPQIDELTATLSTLRSTDPRVPGLQATLGALISQQAQIVTSPRNSIVLEQDAEARSAPISPKPSRDAVLAFIVAGILSAELFVLLEAVSDRFRIENVGEEVQGATGLPILAEVPRGDGPEMIEAFRTLRTSLMFLNAQGHVRTLAIVGVEPGSGKSHTAIGLAMATADLEVPVVLVDADLRRPVIHQRLDLPVRPGLGDLRSRDDLERVAQTVPGHPFLKVVPAGSRVEDPSGLLGGGFRHVLSLINAELVVVDTPAASLFAEATAIAAQCDATIVVLDTRTTRRRSINRLVENLRRVSANPVGIVLNRVDPGPRSSYSYYDRSH